mgnify:CR=1 FL=1
MKINNNKKLKSRSLSLNNKKIQASGYSLHGASRVHPGTAGWVSTSKSPAEDISENLELLRARSRDLYSGGGPLGRGAIDRLTLNAVGPGLKLSARIPGEMLGLNEDETKNLNDKIEAEFDYWAENKLCDYYRQMNFYELQNLAFKSVLLNGDCLILMPYRTDKNFLYDLRIGIIEGDRLQNPLIRPRGAILDQGVELNEKGIPVAYHVANRHPYSELSGQPLLEYKRVTIYGHLTGRRQILHLMPAERINQHRGVPFLSPVIEQLKQLGRYTDAELMAAVVAGMYAIFFTHKLTESEYGEEEYASESGFGQLDDLDFSQQNMSGLVMDLPPGVDPVGVSPARPNSNFDGFVTSLVRQIGGALGIPAELLNMQFTSSYSASRGALLEAWKLFKYWRKWFAVNFCQPLYNEFLFEANLKGRINCPGYFDDDYKQYLYSWCEWTGPAQGQLDPVKEVNAAILRVQNGFSTGQSETMELTGSDFESNAKQIKRENKLLYSDFSGDGFINRDNAGDIGAGNSEEVTEGSETEEAKTEGTSNENEGDQGGEESEINQAQEN